MSYQFHVKPGYKMIFKSMIRNKEVIGGDTVQGLNSVLVGIVDSFRSHSSLTYFSIATMGNSDNTGRRVIFYTINS